MEEEDQSTGSSRLLAGEKTKQADAVPRID
jgi:hypothetical protein